MNPTAKREYSVDAIKGICMLIVVLDHCGLSLHPVVDHLEVPAFFVVSGMFFRDLPFRRHVAEKAKRILVPYLLFSVLFIIPVMIGEYVSGQGDPSPVRRFLRGIAYGENSPLWFLKALFWGLVIYWPINRLLLRHTLKVRFIAFIVAALAMSLTAGPMAQHTPFMIEQTGILQGLQAVPLLMAGTLTIALYRNMLVMWPNKWLVVTCAVCWVLAFLLCRSNIAMYVLDLGQWPLLFYPGAIVSFLALFLLLELILKIVSRIKPAEFYGRHSMSVFGTHCIPIHFLSPLAGWYILFPSALLFSTAFAWFFQKKFPKLKY